MSAVDGSRAARWLRGIVQLRGTVSASPRTIPLLFIGSALTHGPAATRQDWWHVPAATRRERSKKSSGSTRCSVRGSTLPAVGQFFKNSELWQEWWQRAQPVSATAWARISRSLPTKSLSRSLIESAGNDVEIRLRVAREVAAIRKVLAEQAIGVLVRASLPRAMRIAEVDSDASGHREAAMVRKLSTPVPRERALKVEGQYALHEPVLTSLAPDALVALVSPRSSAAAP